MNILLNRLLKRQASFLAQIFTFSITVMVFGSLGVYAQPTIVEVEEIMAFNDSTKGIDPNGYLKMMKLDNFKNLVVETTDELSSNLIADKSDIIALQPLPTITINYSITYNSSEDKIIVWVAGEHTLYGVTVKDSGGSTVYSGSGSPGTYSAPNIESGNNTVYLDTNSGTASETVNVN